MQYSLTKSRVSKIDAPSFYLPVNKQYSNVRTKFFGWCEAQESNRFLWLAITFFAQIGLAVPLTAFSILFFGNNSYLLWIIMCAVNIPTLVLNLAAMPTKTTLPFLFFAWFTEISIILYCLSVGLMQ